MKKQIILFVFGLLVVCFPVNAQQTAIKTNLLHWGSATPNAAVEIGIKNKTSLEIYWGYNPFGFQDNKKWKHWIVQPEYRWWFCERFNGSFLGAHLHGGKFNVGNVGPFNTLKDNRYEGAFYGAGISYGHQWILSNRWSLELTGGVGYAYLKYDKYGCAECSPKVKSGHSNYFGPTKLQLSFIYFLW